MSGGHIQLECNMGVTRCIVGREPNSGIAWDQEITDVEARVAASKRRGACFFRAESAMAQGLLIVTDARTSRIGISVPLNGHRRPSGPSIMWLRV